MPVLSDRARRRRVPAPVLRESSRSPNPMHSPRPRSAPRAVMPIGVTRWRAGFWAARVAA